MPIPRFTMPLAAIASFLSVGLAVAERPFESYDELCGHSIEKVHTTRLSQSRIDPERGPLIQIDPSLDSPMQWFHRKFLIAHECAHHRMKHTSRAGLTERLTRRHAIRDHELSADCWAAEVLTREGHLKHVLDIADQFWRRGFVSPGGGYPSGIQRSNVIRHCAKLATERMRSEYAAIARKRPGDHHP